jgi:molybdate transport system substrate-binding protein
MTTGAPPSITATTEFVVPKSIPIIFAMLRKSSCLLVSAQSYYVILVFLCQGFMSVAFGCSLLVAAASDLSPLEKPLASSIPQCTIRFTFGSSGMIAEQIRHGADYDLFLSANEEYVDRLIRSGSADPASKTRYATGRLGLLSIKSLQWKDLRSVKTLAIATPQHAPYGAAAKQALEHEGLWSVLQSRIVYGENVRQTLQFAQTGNADAAIVAWSLVKDKGGQLLPAEWHQPIIQAAVIPNRSRNAQSAKRLLSFLLSSEGRKLLAEFGFSPVTPVPQSQPASPGR